MDSIKLWARNGEAGTSGHRVRRMAHIETASEKRLTDEFLLFAIDSGLLKSWAGSFPRSTLPGQGCDGGDLADPYSLPALPDCTRYSKPGMCYALRGC